MRYTAQFDAQAWFRDNAMSVDPEGDTVWDCTDYFLTLPEAERDNIINKWYGLDRNDRMKDDPSAPQWVKDWRGPFSIEIIESA